ncbi:ATP-binding cassette domain-containing protein, partial [bacterium]|nr:ATP-binding cassette domain-containing protein [bacterium]
HVIKSCKEYGIPVDIPYCELETEHKELIYSGKDDFEGLNDFIKCLERKRYKKHISILLSRIREYVICPVCDGRRLNEDARRYFIRKKNITDLENMEILELKSFIDDLGANNEIHQNFGLLIKKIQERLDYLIKVGLPYLSLNRRSRTLSGGEFQRIRLASLLGTSLYNTLYILDEPTIGLHGSDSQKLISILKRLRDKDNTIIVVEHDYDFILNSDYLIELGPGGGEQGGKITFQGTIDEFNKYDSITRNEFESAKTVFSDVQKIKSSSMKNALKLNDVKFRNLKSLDLVFPHNTMIAVTGVSGSGKSTLLCEILKDLLETGTKSLTELKKVSKMSGNKNFNSIVMIDQNSIGRSTRSIPATYLKILTEIRKLFAGTSQAKYLGFTKSDFSFNSGSGRCPECNGSGYSCVDLLFLPDLMLPCHVCNGKRFSKELLEVTYNGKNIHEVLNLTLSEAYSFFDSNKLIQKNLNFPIQIGIGYIQLGQVSSTLSGGESQRLKLSKFLHDECGSNLILLDEPTTGLHLKDISSLMKSLKSLKNSGATIITVEHNPYFISQCDWIIDLGPGGGESGGTLMYQGNTGNFITTCDSKTAVYLREFLK